jgi:hypothetical protein
MGDSTHPGWVLARSAWARHLGNVARDVLGDLEEPGSSATRCRALSPPVSPSRHDHQAVSELRPGLSDYVTLAIGARAGLGLAGDHLAVAGEPAEPRLHPADRERAVGPGIRVVVAH